MEEYIKVRKQPGARRAAYPEPGTFTMALTGRSITFHSLSTWFNKAMANYVKALVTEKDVRRWLPSDDKVPHIVIFTDKKTTPPLLKTLSIEFKGRAALGVVLLGSEDLARKMGVKKRPAMVYVQDEATLTGENFDREFKKEALARFLSRCVGRHRSEGQAHFRELTASRQAAGDCVPSDGNYCLLFLGDGNNAALRSLAPKLWLDHVKVFYVKDSTFASSFGVAPGSVLLYRPKRRRFKIFSGDINNVDQLASWVDAAVGKQTLENPDSFFCRCQLGFSLASKATVCIWAAKLELYMAPAKSVLNGKENRPLERSKISAKDLKNPRLTERNTRGAGGGPLCDKSLPEKPAVHRTQQTGRQPGPVTPRSTPRGPMPDPWQEVRQASVDADALEAELKNLVAECEDLEVQVAAAEAQEVEAEQQLTSQSAAMLSECGFGATKAEGGHY
eukprot:symbB.v1.2.025812.t1/scaffold2531.1/size78352/1